MYVIHMKNIKVGVWQQGVGNIGTNKAGSDRWLEKWI
jgi:hypothetical protein